MKLFLTAFHDETHSVLKFFKSAKKEDKRLHTCEMNSTRLISLELGIGFQNAKYSLEKFFATRKEKINQIFVVGFCGALDPSLDIGQIVLPTAVQNEQGQIFALSAPSMKENLVPVNKILSVDKIIRTSQQKKDFFNNTKCQVVDMESGPIAEIAQKQNIPLTVIKAVMDSGEQEIPQNIRQPFEEEKNLLIELKNNLKMAQERLEKDFLEKFIAG